MPLRRRRAGEEGNKNETRYSIAKKSKKEAEEDVRKEILEEEAKKNKELPSTSTAFSTEVLSDANSKIDVVYKNAETENLATQEHNNGTFSEQSASIIAGDMIQEPHHVISSSFLATNIDDAGLLADNMYHSSDEDDDEQLEVPSSVYLPLLSISFYLKDKLTKTALGHHLNILRAAGATHIPELESVHRLLSKYGHLKMEVSKRYLCNKPKCSSLLVLNEKGEPNPKQPCGHKRRPNLEPGKECFVMNLPIEKQLVYFVEHHGLKSRKDYDPNYRSDVDSGSCYRKLIESGDIDDSTITLQLNTDGAECHKVSEFSFWPLMGIINEASYKLRRSYVILMAIWYGNKKPPMDPFMDETISELNRLQRNGFTAGGKIYKVRVLIITTDSVARPLVCGTTQFNGAFGCSFCLAEGKTVKKGSGYARVYLEPSKKSELPKLRTIEQHKTDLAEVMRTKKRIHGIVEPTPLAKLDHFDFIEALVPEYLHSCCEGVFKLLIELWTSSKHSKSDWYIGSLDKIGIINTKLGNIEPPYEVTRSTAPINKLKVWKASMFRSFTLYYFHVLEDVLPPIYFQHFCKLVYGISLLLRESVSIVDVEKVDVLFRDFVKEFELLYGIEDVRINVHFLTHLAQAVLNWGCLWATSTFIPEWFNGELNNLFHGSQSVVDQMGANYLLRQEVKREAMSLINSKALPPHVHLQLRQYLSLPTTNDDESKGKLVNDRRVRLLGTPENRNLTIDEEIAFRNCFSQEKYQLLCPLFDPLVESFGTCHSYPRFKIIESGSIFTTTSYALSPKRTNYCALLADGAHILIESILSLDSVHRNVCAFVSGRKIGIEGKRVFTPDPIKISPTQTVVFSSFPEDTAELHGIENTLSVYPICSVVSKCVLSLKNSLTDTYIATGLVNNLETD